MSPRQRIGALERYQVEAEAALRLITRAWGLGGSDSIPDAMTFREWCEDLAAKGLKIDQKPFSLADRPALIPIYDAIPVTREEASRRTIVIQKATQLGLTVWEVLADLYMARKWGPVSIGMFMPDQTTASFKSQHRFMPILASAPELYRQLVIQQNDDGTTRKVGEGNILTRVVGNSLLMFLWTSGKVTTESRPMDIVSLDEVQEMALDQIDKVRRRMGDSKLAFSLMLSTANMPDLDINQWYKRGTQEVWHTRCQACGELSDLSDPAGIFPGKSIAYNDGSTAAWARAPLNEYLWTCPRCRSWIEDPQIGETVVTNPGGDPMIRSFLLPRTISPRETPRQMYKEWTSAQTGDQKKSFYNRALARPYIDADQLPVTMATCEACVDEGKAQRLTWEQSGRGYFMGIDQMASFQCIIIKRRMPDGRQATVHVEAVYDLDPWKRAAALMKQFGIAFCVVEQLPNADSARAFANRFRGRVFLATYAPTYKSDMVSWGDQLSRSDTRTAEEDRDRYMVTIQRYKAMQTALYRVRDKLCLFPDPASLEQEYITESGERQRGPVARDMLFAHLTRVALIVETDPDSGERTPRVQKIGADPHFAFANMLCDVAWSRAHGASLMIDGPAEPHMPGAVAITEAGQRVEAAMPGLPKHIVSAIDSAPPGSCGSCISYDRERGRWCSAREVGVGPNDPGCVLHVPVEDEDDEE